MHSHPGATLLSGAALTHGYAIAFYVLTGFAFVGAMVAAAFIDSKPAEFDAEVVDADAVPMEAAA